METFAEMKARYESVDERANAQREIARAATAEANKISAEGIKIIDEFWANREVDLWDSGEWADLTHFAGTGLAWEMVRDFFNSIDPHIQYDGRNNERYIARLIIAHEEEPTDELVANIQKLAKHIEAEHKGDVVAIFSVFEYRLSQRGDSYYLKVWADNGTAQLRRIRYSTDVAITEVLPIAEVLKAVAAEYYYPAVGGEFGERDY